MNKIPTVENRAKFEIMKEKKTDNYRFIVLFF
jgi:hypothetical protein